MGWCRSFRLSTDHDYGDHFYPNENQAVELSDGVVGAFARGLGFRRTRTLSHDGGEHWQSTEIVQGQFEPLTGCEGSTIACRNGSMLVYSGVLNEPIIRADMSILTSRDYGHSWRTILVVDVGAAAYSSLAWCGAFLGLLYERASSPRIVFEPDHISFARLADPCQ